jgi:hypothetical protein
MSEELVLFDLPSRDEAGNKAWSGNTWKGKLINHLSKGQATAVHGEMNQRNNLLILTIIS